MSSLKEDCDFLRKPLLLEGPVTKGYGRGSKKLGVPTANLPHFDSQLKESDYANGVYFGWGLVQGDTQAYPVVANIGRSPTFVGEENRVNIVEAHLLGRGEKKEGGVTQGEEDNTFSDFYGRVLSVALVAFLRGEKKFDSFDALVGQINKDLVKGRELAEAARNEPSGRVANARSQVEPFVLTQDPTTVSAQGLLHPRTLRVATESGAISSWTTFDILY